VRWKQTKKQNMIRTENTICDNDIEENTTIHKF